MTKPDTRPAAYSLRLDPDLSQWVKAQAKDNDRSINAEINRLIRQAKEGAVEKEAFGHAFLEGMAAAEAGKPRDANPYLQTPYKAFLLRMAWFDGWDEVQNDCDLFERP